MGSFAGDITFCYFKTLGTFINNKINKTIRDIRTCITETSTLTLSLTTISICLTGMTDTLIFIKKKIKNILEGCPISI